MSFHKARQGMGLPGNRSFFRFSVKKPVGSHNNSLVMAMTSCHSHRHKSKSSARAKGRHKDGKDPLHIDHTEYRDPDGLRNAPSDRLAESKLWFAGVISVEDFINAEAECAVDKRGRDRELVGFGCIFNPCDDIQSDINALLDVDSIEGNRVLDRGDQLFRDLLEKKFPTTRRIEARHSDKERFHWETILLKYDEAGNLIPKCIGVGRDGPGVTAVKSEAAATGKKVNLGKAGKHWNSRADVKLTLELQSMVREIVAGKDAEFQQAFAKRRQWWFEHLQENISPIAAKRREKKKEWDLVEEEIEAYAQEHGINSIIEAQALAAESGADQRADANEQPARLSPSTKKEAEVERISQSISKDIDQLDVEPSGPEPDE